MKVYVAHPRGFDFARELYCPIRKSFLNDEHFFVLPHEKSSELFDSKGFFESGCDLVIAEVSGGSVGVGIELGWANACGVKIVCFYRKGFKFSGSLKAVCENFFEYEDCEDLVLKIGEILK